MVKGYVGVKCDGCSRDSGPGRWTVTLREERQYGNVQVSYSLCVKCVGEMEQRRRDVGIYDGGFGDPNCPADY